MINLIKSKFFLLALLIIIAIPVASEAALYETKKWEIDNNNNLIIEYTGSTVPLTFPPADDVNDIYYIITGFSTGTQINLYDNWTLDTDGNAVTIEDMSKVQSLGGSNVKISGSNKILINYNGIQFTGRYTAPKNSNHPDYIAAHYQAWYREPKFSSKDSWLTENYEYNWTLRQHGNESKLKYFHADEIVSGTGQGNIASWQYPMLNFYDSRNIELQKCHAAIMKISGINAVIFDFYGADDIADYRNPRINSNSFINNVLEPAGMNYLIFYEEFSALREASSTTEAKERIKRSFEWLNSNWFNKKGYVKYNNRPVVMLFVTQQVLTTVEEWNNLASQAGVNPLPLFVIQDAWLGGNVEAAFNWMPVNPNYSFSSPSGRKIYTGSERVSFINSKFQEFLQRASNCEYLITTAYPGFDDSVFDELGRFNENGSHNAISFDNGETFKQTFDLALNAKPNIIQLGTWNDYNEDTVIEPSMSSLCHKTKTEISRGYSSLEYVQKRKNEWENLGWTAEDLRAPVELYNLAMSPGLTAEQKSKINAAYDAIFSDNVQNFRNIAASLINYNSSLNPILRAEITTTKLNDGTKNNSYNMELKASGSEPFTWSITSGKLPNGLTLNPSTGKISGVPLTSGTFNFTVRVLNSAGITASNSKSFTLTIKNSKTDLGITTSKLKTGKISKKYKSVLKTKITPPLYWTASGLPEGLEISYNSTKQKAEITGVPIETGVFNVTVNASNSSNTFTKNFQLIVKNVKPKFITKKLPEAFTGEMYSALLEASGGAKNDKLIWSISWKTSKIIDGLTIDNKNASIYGTPLAANKKGSYKVKAIISNSAGKRTKNFTIKLKDDK